MFLDLSAFCWSSRKSVALERPGDSKCSEALMLTCKGPVFPTPRSECFPYKPRKPAGRLETPDPWGREMTVDLQSLRVWEELLRKGLYMRRGRKRGVDDAGEAEAMIPKHGCGSKSTGSHFGVGAWDHRFRCLPSIVHPSFPAPFHVY